MRKTQKNSNLMQLTSKVQNLTKITKRNKIMPTKPYFSNVLPKYFENIK